VILFDWELDYLARKEHVKDLIREVEQAQLIDAAQFGADQAGSQSKVTHWLGSQMIKWGSKLQRS
jgi:hypothetical protein